MSNTSISVHVRIRPHKPSDGTAHPDDVLLTDRTVSVPSGNKHDPTQRLKFKLDACHGPESTQEEVFEKVKPIMEQVYRGINTTVFAYGVTGSGKTWTMQGAPKDPGVIPRVVKHIFNKKSRLKKSTLKISFSYVEILVEEVYDLLVARKPGETMKKLDIRTTSTGENIIADLTSHDLSSVQEFEDLYHRAGLSRKTAATNLNSSSSRSHAILTLRVETTEVAEGKTYVGKICLVDLAGSEDNNLTGNDPQRMRESSAINRSLTTLGNVVEALNNGSGRIPYRDSKLTRILQDALGGSSVGMLICNLAPGDKYAKDTLRTLKFATRTREIENKPVVNERDDRVLPRPHFSAPTRPTMKTSLAPPVRPGSAKSIPTNAVAGPSCQPLRPSVAPPQQSHVNLGEQVRREAREGGITLTEEQLNDRIQTIVKQVMTEQAKAELKPVVEVKPIADPTAATIESAPDPVRETSARGGSTVAVDLSSLTDEEIRSRAKVLTNLARQHHDKHELELAIKYYKEARVYMPTNDRLNRRITELELALLGQMPIPDREGTKPTTSTASPGQKRKRGETQADDNDNDDVPTGSTKAPLESEQEKKPRLKRSKAKISLSELTDETKAEVGAVVKKVQVLGDRTVPNKDPKAKPLSVVSANEKNKLKPTSISAKPETKLPGNVVAGKAKAEVVKMVFNDEDKENGGPAPPPGPAAKRTRQVRKPVAVLLDDSYQQSDDGEESDEYMPEVVARRPRRKIGVRA